MILKRQEISSYREDELREIKNICPILKVKMNRSGAIRPVLDHSHEVPIDDEDNSQCGRVRGVISQAANTFLGRIEKYWKKYCKNHTNESLSDTLRNVADFLDEDHSENPIHHSELDKHRKRLSKSSLTSIQQILKDNGLSYEGLDKNQLTMLVISGVILPKYEEENYDV